VFSAAGRQFLNAPPPEGYLEEWTERLIEPIEESATDLQSILIFRLADEWLALRVQVLLEVTGPRTVHCIPQRTGLLAGLVNIRGELHLCVHLSQILGIKSEENGHSSPDGKSSRPRMIVVENQGERWVFPVDEVDQVYRLAMSELTNAPATLARSTARLTKAVVAWRERSIGFLDDERLFRVLRSKIQ
jgi:chemotaxis-related protein WspD